MATSQAAAVDAAGAHHRTKTPPQQSPQKSDELDFSDHSDDDSSEDGLLDEEAREAPKETQKEEPVTWSSLPRKDQLILLVIARLAEPLTNHSIQAYIYHQVQSFSPDAPESLISRQTGIVQAAFTGAQFCTAILWGRLADSDRIGRKRVLLCGLLGTCLSCLGFGFSRNYASALCFRIAAGAMNGNAGVMRTMTAEIILEKRFQSRAFLLLPMCFNIGVIIGPMVGGALADPVDSFPGIFGPGSALGGKDGVWWMQHWPYALPNFFSAAYTLCGFILVLLFLDETHPSRQHVSDRGRQLGKKIYNLIRGHGHRRNSSYQYTQINDMDGAASLDLEERPRTASTTVSNPTTPSTPSPKPTLWTKNVLLTLINGFLVGLHIGTFNQLVYIFLPAPRVTPPQRPSDGPFHFTGGLGLNPQRVGTVSAIIGCIGLPLQILLYPRIHAILGTMRAFRAFLPFSILCYTAMPFLVFIPASSPTLLWPAIALVVASQVLSRTFVLPASVILINNSCPDRRILGMLNGVAQSVGSGARTIGPLLGGWGLGLGLKERFVGGVWWGMAGVACVGWVCSLFVIEGEGPGV